MSKGKTASLLALAVAALMALASPASATTLTGQMGEPTPTVDFFSEVDHLVLANPIANIECELTTVGTVTQHGAGSTAVLPLSGGLFWTNCTNNWHVTTLISGSLEFHYTGSGTGTLTWSEMTITATRFGVTCHYYTQNTDIGAVTDTSHTGFGATVHIEAQIPIKSSSSSPLCGSGAARWEGSITSNTKLSIDP